MAVVSVHTHESKATAKVTFWSPEEPRKPWRTIEIATGEDTVDFFFAPEQYEDFKDALIRALAVPETRTL